MTVEPEGLGLREAIESVRADVAAAYASAAEADVQFPVTSVTVQLQVVATTTAGGRAGFKVPVVNLEVGGEGSRTWQDTSVVTMELGAPVDRDGRPIKVGRSTGETLG